MELNTLLFAKTLARKDIASSVTVTPQANGNGRTEDSVPAEGGTDLGSEGGEFSSKAQIMTLMTTDVDRVSKCRDAAILDNWYAGSLFFYSCIDAERCCRPHRLALGNCGRDCISVQAARHVLPSWGLAVTCLFLPVNHIASKVVMGAQNNLMKARDERVSLMNEVRHSFPFSWLRDLRCICGVEGPGCHKNVEGALVGSLVTA